jgi:hypothetical protein
MDDEQARGLRRLLLGKGAVFAHRFERSLTAEMDESEQRPTPDAGRRAAAPSISGRLHQPGTHTRSRRPASARIDRVRDFCFAQAEQSSEEAVPTQLVLAQGKSELRVE